MTPFSKSLLAATILTSALVPGVQAQSVTLTAVAPKGSVAADVTSKDKTLPTSTKFTPCRSNTEKDQFTFTIKYDTGTANPMANVYLIFKDSAGNLYSFNRGALNTETEVATPAAGKLYTASGKAYVWNGNNLGGAQTEVVLGGSIPLEGLPTGLYSLTAVIATEANALDKDMTGWLAWDSLPILIGAPWTRGTAVVTGGGSCV